jgi:hypothetical protein
MQNTAGIERLSQDTQRIDSVLDVIRAWPNKLTCWPQVERPLKPRGRAKRVVHRGSR